MAITQESLEIMVKGIMLAQSRGAYNLEEASVLYKVLDPLIKKNPVQPSKESPAATEAATPHPTPMLKPVEEKEVDEQGL